MHYGVQYYPEHWPEERWPTDAAMMQRAGVNTVRMGEFAWSAYEPAEGRVDFTWMDRALAMLRRHGIHTILCTCSRTPPPWVYARYPGVVNVRPDGLPENAEDRYRAGLAHPEFVALAERIDTALVEHFRGREEIVGWQVDNEVGSGNDCYCPRCRAAFRDYLRARYGTVERLNAAWGSHFWSLHFTDFDDVPLPGSSPQVRLEYRRFLSSLNVGFTQWRSELIRRLDPGKWVTTNFQNIRATHTDVRDFMRVIDIPGMNHYPQRTPELAIDYYRGPHGRVLALEQFTRLQHVDAGEGWMRLWAWLAVAHGASGVIHFRWRQCRWGNEQFADGVLPHAGQENRLYRELARTGGELGRLGGLLDATKPAGRAAVVYSYESRWAVGAGLYPREMEPIEEARTYHEALKRRNVPTDAMDPREDLSAYPLVIAPRLWVVDEAIAANLRRYVAAGGTLCLTAGSGVVDEFGKSFDVPRPGPLREVAGVNVTDLASLGTDTAGLASDVIPGLTGTRGGTAADEIHTTTAETIATFADGWRRGRPAVTLHHAGAGRVVYVGTLCSAAGAQAIVDWLCDQAGVKGLMETPPGVTAYERRGADARVWFILNFTDAPQRVHLPEPCRDAFDATPCESIEIGPVDLRVVVPA